MNERGRRFRLGHQRVALIIAIGMFIALLAAIWGAIFLLPRPWNGLAPFPIVVLYHRYALGHSWFETFVLILILGLLSILLVPIVRKLREKAHNEQAVIVSASCRDGAEDCSTLPELRTRRPVA